MVSDQDELALPFYCRAQVRLTGNQRWVDLIAVLNEPLPHAISDRAAIEVTLREVIRSRGLAFDLGPILFPVSDTWLADKKTRRLPSSSNAQPSPEVTPC